MSSRKEDMRAPNSAKRLRVVDAAVACRCCTNCAMGVAAACCCTGCCCGTCTSTNRACVGAAALAEPKEAGLMTSKLRELRCCVVEEELRDVCTVRCEAKPCCRCCPPTCCCCCPPFCCVHSCDSCDADGCDDCMSTSAG